MARNTRKGGFSSAKYTALLLNNLGFIVFVGFLAVIYIGNAHYAEYNVRRIQVLEKEIRHQRWLYMSLQSDIMSNSLRSDVAERVREDGLRLHRGTPHKIVVEP